MRLAKTEWPRIELVRVEQADDDLDERCPHEQGDGAAFEQSLESGDRGRLEEVRKDREELAEDQRKAGDSGGDVNALCDLVEIRGLSRKAHPGQRLLQEVAVQPGGEADQKCGRQESAENDGKARVSRGSGDASLHVQQQASHGLGLHRTLFGAEGCLDRAVRTLLTAVTLAAMVVVTILSVTTVGFFDPNDFGGILWYTIALWALFVVAVLLVRRVPARAAIVLIIAGSAVLSGAALTWAPEHEHRFGPVRLGRHRAERAGAKRSGFRRLSLHLRSRRRRARAVSHAVAVSGRSERQLRASAVRRELAGRAYGVAAVVPGDLHHHQQAAGTHDLPARR